RAKFQFLDELPKQRLDAETTQFIVEQRRRFGDAPAGAVFSGPTWVGPIMSAEDIRRAKDEDVINAFRKLPDATGWDNPKHWLKGGNVQLARAFADFAKTDAQRAQDLILRMDPDIGSLAAGYAIEVMAEEADSRQLIDLVHILEDRGFASEEYR